MVHIEYKLYRFHTKYPEELILIALHIMFLSLFQPENIVLKEKHGTDIKLVDFGLAQIVTPGEELKEMMGTPEFVAPEIINYECIGLYTDMW